ncbi:deadenylation-dependent mRNA-decapping factor PAT1 [Sporobolomyces salmoneus]|uniref:deadenylation-dependent mRNA-decapping factor PAT1 n=1 Tax=Sporobolomyces salmoneus TaxID=183962 RepID=UPI0031773FFE
MEAVDLEVYHFDSLGGENDLAGLLDEDLNEFNSETFGSLDDLGDAAPLGRDFDFAGSTNRFLGSDAASTAGLQPSKANDSPWGTLNDDPLLSRAPTSTYSAPNIVSGGGGGDSRTMTTPARPPMKTLEEVEAELRATARPPVPTAPQGPRPLTVEEVEAEMLRNSRQVASQNQVASPQVAPPTFPGPPASGNQVPLPALGTAPFPPPIPGMFPPGMPPAMVAMLHAQHQQQQLEQQRLVQGQRAPVSHLPPQNAALSTAAFPPLGSSPPPPSQHLAGNQGPNLMATLFPPLPSQGQQPLPQQPVPTANLDQVEQQLHLLTLNQHAQHPSLTSAHLHSLLQQAQKHAAAQGTSDGTDLENSDENEEAERKRAAGEEIIKRVEMRIMEHERMEMMRKKKAMKIASMAKHNNLMSNSDKDFITRIQVSQLITDDPYADDFYFHIMAAIRNARQNAILAAINESQGQTPLPGSVQGPTSGNQGGLVGGAGTQSGNRRPTRRENAMNRMAQNVQRLVDSAKKRNANTPNTLSLDGALGKIATRTRSAPRPLLQVAPSTSSAAVPTAANLGLDSDKLSSTPPPGSTPSHSTGESLLTGAGLIAKSATSERPASDGPLSHRDALAIIEKLYDTVLDLEQLRRIQPALHATEAGLKEQLEQMTVEGEIKEQMKERYEEARSKVQAGDAKYEELREVLWQGLRVMDPLDACVPHPFISILSVLKGKRLLPRAIRHLSAEQTLTLLTLLVATFDTLDVVVDASLLDQLDTTGSLEAKQRRLAVETKTEALLNAVVAPIMQVVGTSQLRMVTGMLGLLLDRNDLASVVRSKPGLAFLTILLSRAESLNQSTPPPEPADLAQWERTFTYLFSILSSSLLTLFPSTRMAASVPFGVAQYQSVDALRPEADFDDEPVWRFLAAVAVCADPDQQQVLVTSVRDKVIEGVKGAKMGRGGPELSAIKIRNVNLLLHALSLDASMIEID